MEDNSKLLNRQKELTKILNEYAYNYYVLEKPIVSDYDYDILYDELVKLEGLTHIILPSSPTQRVGGEILSGFKKVNHPIRLYSFNKCNDYDGVCKFIDDINAVKPKQKFVVEYKFDGLRIIVKYSNGLFVQASTRGNGVVGEDVTEQVKTIKSVPLKIDYKGDLLVAGEGVITLQNLEKYNKTADEKLKNARNAVAGAIRNLDPKVTAKRNLDIVFYDILKIDEDKKLTTQNDVYEFLKENKFLTGKLFEEVCSASEIKDIIDRVDKIKSKLDILIDGLVIKLNDIKLRDEIGFTAKFPKWAIAYKFAPQELTTILKDVEWGVGRTGKITPIALIEPVELSGATITRATLNNVEDIARKKIKKNSLIFIRRSNEVIPEILGLAQEFPNSQIINPPIKCPSCGSEVFKKGPNLFCSNDFCPQKTINKISYFASRNCMNIDGLSEKIIKVLFENKLLKSFSDLYKLTKEDFVGIEGFKDKKIANILNSIQKSKTVDLANFINSLSIDEVGEKTASDLAKKFKTLDNIKNLKFEDLISVKDIGEITAKNIFEYFNNSNNLIEIENLKNCGIVILEKQTKIINNQSPFLNKKIVLTGTLEKYKRFEAIKIIEEMGGEVASSVSKNTDMVLVGNDAGSKLEKAKALNIKIINENEFDDLLKDIN